MNNDNKEACWKCITRGYTMNDIRVGVAPLFFWKVVFFLPLWPLGCVTVCGSTSHAPGVLLRKMNKTPIPNRQPPTPNPNRGYINIIYKLLELY